MGFEYGPAFQGLRAAWRRGEELFAEVELSSEQRDGAVVSACTPRCWIGAARRLSALVDGAKREPGRGGRRAHAVLFTAWSSTPRAPVSAGLTVFARR